MGTDGQTGRHLLLAGIITAFSVILIMITIMIAIMIMIQSIKRMNPLLTGMTTQYLGKSILPVEESRGN